MRAIPWFLILLLLQLLLPSSVSVRGSGGFWARTWGGSSEASGRKVAVDELGNIFVVGSIQGDYVTKPNVVLKFNSTGSMLWQRTWGGRQYGWDDTTHTFAVDFSGNVYVTGPAVGYDNITVLKLNSTGDFVWGKSWGSINASSTGLITNDMAADRVGNIYVTGYTWWKPETTHLFLLKLNSTGNVLWLKVSINTLNSFFNGGSTLTISPAGDVYVTGRPIIYTSGPDGNPFLLKFNSSGSLLWQESLGSTMPFGIATDQQGGVIIGGYVYGVHSTTILKLDSSGAPLWQRTTTAFAFESVATDNASGNIFVTGYFGGVVLAEFDPLGNILLGRMWGESPGGGNSVAVDSSGTPIVTGGVAYNPPHNSSDWPVSSNSTTPSVGSLNASFTTMKVQEESPEILLQTPTDDTTGGHLFIFKGIPIASVPSSQPPLYALILTVGAGVTMAGVAIWNVKKRRSASPHTLTE